MNLEDFKITSGINSHQNASIERNEKTIDYSSSKPLSYADILSITKGLNVISEFFDVNAVVTVSGTNISAVALGKSLEEAIVQAMDSNPLDFVNANVEGCKACKISGSCNRKRFKNISCSSRLEE